MSDFLTPHGPEANRYLGPYRLIQRLGGGATGFVWEAVDITLRRRLAIKILKPDYAADADMQRRFAREARLMSTLSVEGVPAVHAFGEEEGLFYFTMTLVKGRFAHLVLRDEGPLSFVQVAEILKKLLTTLHRVHQAGIVHRDIKPEHLLLARDQVILLDFGCAKPMEETEEEARERGTSPGMTLYGRMLGTQGYIAPEVWGGQPATVQSDLFAVGATAVDLLLGERWLGGHPKSVIQQRLREGPETMLLRAGVNQKAAAFLASLTAVNATRRPASAEEALARLDTLTAPREVFLPPPSSTAPAGRSLSGAAMALFAVLGLVGGLVWLAAQMPAATTKGTLTDGPRRVVYLSSPATFRPGDRVRYNGPVTGVVPTPQGWTFTAGGQPLRWLSPTLVLHEGDEIRLLARVAKVDDGVVVLEDKGTLLNVVRSAHEENVGFGGEE